MNLFELFLLFAKIGLFTIGGGLVTIPVIRQEVVERGLISLNAFYDMVAISESTPGAIGLNIATYIGFDQAGIPGAIAATVGVSAPSVAIVCLLSALIFRYFSNPHVIRAKYGIRAAATGLIASAAYQMFSHTILTLPTFAETQSIANIADWKALSLYLGIILLNLKVKWNVIAYIGIGALFGIILL